MIIDGERVIDQRKRDELKPYAFTCDWGDCDGPTAGFRWDDDSDGDSKPSGYGWLPVCQQHLEAENDPARKIALLDSSQGHIDFMFDGMTCCKVCGLVRPAAGWMRPCKGPCELSLRADVGSDKE
jgi:hypothetical protein